MRTFKDEKDIQECCGTCRHHGHDDMDRSTLWRCMNGGSIYVTEATDYNDYCPEYEAR